jgi:hypothetical protein
MTDSDGLNPWQAAQREHIRWIVLDAVNHGRPYPIAETLILRVIESLPIQCTALELRRELEYLEGKYVVLWRCEGAPWIVLLTSAGVDAVEYTVDVEPGIARPNRGVCTFAQRQLMH